MDLIQIDMIRKGIMLVSFRVRNFALIENADIEFGEGFNVLSGETGSGKSILVQAIELLGGGRGSADLIRQGEEEAEVCGFFRMGEEEISLRRVVTRGGKNRAYLNERPVPVATLSEAGEKVIDIVSQNEHQILLRPDQHLPLLDEFAGLVEKIETFQGHLSRYRLISEERERLVSREREAREKEEFLRFQLKEISEGGVREGEEEDLQKEREIIRNAVRLGEVCLKGEEALDSGEDSTTERVGKVLRDLVPIVGIDPQLSPLAQNLEEALCRLQEVAKTLRDYGTRLAFDPERLQEIEDRLALISRLKKKYGGTLELILSKERELTGSLTLLENFEGELQKRGQEIEEVETVLLSLARELSRKRKSAAAQLSRDVEQELEDLGMTSCKFEMSLSPLSQGVFQKGEVALGERGCEEGEFLVVPNPGEGKRPLAKVASGGELSRIFLAIKKVLGGIRGAPTLIFDEVDSGIGGGVAEVVGKNLYQLARKKQVLCITHLPQIACFADHHFVIQKRTMEGRTETQVQLLRKEEREEEIARMLAGLKITDKTIAHAREMLRNAVRMSS